MPGFGVRLDVDDGLRVNLGVWMESAPHDVGIVVLRLLHELGQQAVEEVRRLTRCGRLAAPFALGRLTPHDDTPSFIEAMRMAQRAMPVELRSPFEDCPTIAGGLWRGSDVFGSHRDDGLALLHFAAGTTDLPLHVHEHSDRCLYVLEGEGEFHASPQDWRTFDGEGVEITTVRPGDVVVFNRGVLHTFSAARRDLVLISYHSPALAFDDPRQFSLPPVRSRSLKSNDSLSPCGVPLGDIGQITAAE